MDNYQGEEGKVSILHLCRLSLLDYLRLCQIVILSLVRNAGTFEDDTRALGFNQGRRPTIGFLKVGEISNSLNFLLT